MKKILPAVMASAFAMVLLAPAPAMAGSPDGKFQVKLLGTGVLPDGIEAQTRAVMENLKVVLADLDLGLEHVVMTRIYLTRFKEDYTAMNETYRTYFAPGRLPARTCVGVTGLAYDALIEIDLVCRRP